jgi:uncharacterized membrane protein
MDDFREARVVGLTALLFALPLWFLLWCGGAFQDKPYGWHVTPASYGLTGVTCVATAVLCWWVARRVLRRPQADGVYVAVCAGAGLLLALTFCLRWNAWVQEFRDSVTVPYGWAGRKPRGCEHGRTPAT